MLKYIPIVFIAVILSACTAYNKVSNQNLYFSYRKEFNTIHPQFRVLNENDSLTKVHYRFSWSEFLFIKSLNDSAFRASAKINYRLLENYESKLVLDSNSITLNTASSTSTSDKIESGNFIIKTTGTLSGIIEITLTDQGRNQYVKHYITLDRKSNSSKQYFLVKKKDELMMTNILNGPDTVSVQHVNSSTKELFIRYYNRQFPLAPPPFSDYMPKPFLYKADSTYSIKSGDDSVFTIPVVSNGFYHIQTDSTQKEGLTLFYFHENYPAVATAEDLINPLRYITSKKEYDVLLAAENKKAAIDDFWMNVAGSEQRAKELIRTFYNRVQDANQYFASYLEGWKTDRGLMYIIYGPPTAVYRTNNSESWVYGEGSNIRSLHFTFVKVINPFTENDYSLVRNENYKDSWYMAVDTWRQGRVFAD